MGFFDNIKGMFGMSEAQREAKRIQERTQRENSLEAESINYILRCIDVFNSDASASVRLAHLGKAKGTLTFILETYPHREDWQNLLQQCNAAYSSFMTQQLQGELEKLLSRADMAKTRASKISNANKGLLLIQQAADDPDNSYPASVLTAWREQFTSYIHQTELDELLMKADKCEFKGEWKKAVSAYQDVLYFLKRDHIPDEEQAGQLAEIEGKIAEMQKYFKESKRKAK